MIQPSSLSMATADTPMAPVPPVAPVALEQALEQSHEVKAKVEACAEDLAQANEGTKRTIAAGATTLPARQTLDHNEVVETKVQECADDLDSVTKTLARGIDELKVVEVALASSRTALEETSASLASALASEERANLRALHDHTTGLPNRALFDDRLSQALALAERHDWTVAVMFLDLDRFKNVNDVHGHAAGDVVLKEVAKRLAQDARDEDTVCRNGGDGFLYLLVNPQGRDNVERIAAAVIDNLARTIRVGEKQLTVRPSIGIAIYPDGGVNGEALIQNADAAMYRAKKIECGYAVHEPQVGHDQSET
jgi:diguanylate cyclase